MNTQKGKNAKSGREPLPLINLGKFADGDYITKEEMCVAFKCSPRTMQRMVERFEIRSAGKTRKQEKRKTRLTHTATRFSTPNGARR